MKILIMMIAVSSVWGQFYINLKVMLMLNQMISSVSLIWYPDMILIIYCVSDQFCPLSREGLPSLLWWVNIFISLQFLACFNLLFQCNWMHFTQFKNYADLLEFLRFITTSEERCSNCNRSILRLKLLKLWDLSTLKAQLWAEHFLQLSSLITGSKHVLDQIPLMDSCQIIVVLLCLIRGRC